MKISLVMVTSDGTNRELAVPKLPLIVGRSAECKLRIPVDSVSRQHCELDENDDEELVVRDLKSSNGTFVNRERVKERELLPGDLISIGPVVFVVRIDGHPKNIDPATAFKTGAVAVGGGSASMMDGVPTWSAQSTPESGTSVPQASRPAPAASPSSSEDDSFESLLRNLREDDDRGSRKD